MSGFSVSLPLKYDKTDGPYLLNKQLIDVVRQNLKMLVLTNPGERVMDTDFGVGAKSLLFQNISRAELGNIQSRLLTQVNKYLPFISIGEVAFTTTENDPNINDNTVYIKIIFSVPSLSQTDTLNIILSSN